MKYNIKGLMAMLLFCLPFSITSCGSDDDANDNNTKTYTYEWTLINTKVETSDYNEKQAAIIAEIMVKNILKESFGKIGKVFISDKDNKNTLVIAGGEEKINDVKVRTAFYDVAYDIYDAAKDLPDNACITVKRGSIKVIDNEKLKDENNKGFSIPKTYTYEWTLTNATISNGSLAEQQAAVNAQIAVNSVLVKTFSSLGMVNSEKQTLSITGGEVKSNDNKVKSTYYGAANKVSVAAACLPDNARITIKRGGTKVIDNEKLK